MRLVAILLAAEGRTAVVCASAGNLGQALGWSGRRRGLDVTVATSRWAPAAKLDRIAVSAWSWSWSTATSKWPTIICGGKVDLDAYHRWVRG